MAPIPKGGTVAVTGSTGFIGGWVVKQLLDKGYRVRACVRDVEDQEKTGFLRAMPGYASGRLTLHTADLDSPGCFDDVFRGCHGVAHLSHVSTYDDEDYVKQVCDHTIESINLSGSVSRVVVTSSIAAVISEQDIQELVPGVSLRKLDSDVGWHLTLIIALSYPKVCLFLIRIGLSEEVLVYGGLRCGSLYVSLIGPLPKELVIIATAGAKGSVPPELRDSVIDFS